MELRDWRQRGLSACRRERREAENGTSVSHGLKNGPKRQPNLNWTFKMFCVLIGNPVDPETGGGPEKRFDHRD